MDRQKIIRIIARILGILSSVLAVYFIAFKGMAHVNEGNQQIITINVMFVFLIFGFIIAWFREKEGGVILSFGAVISYLYFHYLPNLDIIANWVYSLLFGITGLLFLYLSSLKKKKETD